MINEQLQLEISECKKLEKKLHYSEEIYRTIFETSGIAMVVIEEDGTISMSNMQFEKISGYSKKEVEGGKKWTEFILEDHLGRMEKYHDFRRMDKSNIPQTYEFRAFDRKGGVRDILVTMVMIPGTQKSLASLFDITERKKFEDAIINSEKKYSSLVENSLIGIYISQDGRYVFSNDRFAKTYGYSREEIVGLEWWKLVPPADRAIISEMRAKRLMGGQVPLEYEARGLTKEGKIIWVARKLTVIEHNGKSAILGNVMDITQRKTMETSLRESGEKLQFLSSELLTAQEMERRRISMELHDELGQSLAFLKLNLRSIEKRLPEKQRSIKRDCENALKYIDQVIDNVRRLSRGLNPAVLEQLGLRVALRYLIEDFSEHFQIETSFTTLNFDQLFSQQVQIGIYRIFQEVFNNIRKHGKATHTSVSIKKKDRKIIFLVKDNGKGFDARKAKNTKPHEKGLGLAIMNERARLIGGSLVISSQEKKGTRIALSIPLDEGGKS